MNELELSNLETLTALIKEFNLVFVTATQAPRTGDSSHILQSPQRADKSLLIVDYIGKIK